MINFFENDHAMPIILGNCKEVIAAAKILRKKTKLDITVLSDKLSLFNKTRFMHRKLTSAQDAIILLTLEDIVRELKEYATPLLIYCKEHNGDFISKYTDNLEHLYVIIPAQEIKSFFEGNS